VGILRDNRTLGVPMCQFLVDKVITSSIIGEELHLIKDDLSER